MKPFIAYGLALFVGYCAIEIGAVEAYLGYEEPSEEGFDFTFCCFGGCGPTLYESLENLWSVIITILMTPAYIVTDVLVFTTDTIGLTSRHTERIIPFLELRNHINAAIYLLLGFLIHRKTA